MSKKPENKDELNIQELLKNSGIESMLDLNKIIGKIKKTFYWIYFRCCISKCSHSKMCYPSNKKFYKTCISKRCCIVYKWYEKNL